MLHKSKNKKPLGTFIVAMLSLAVVISLRNLPIMASLGLSSLFFYALAVCTFMIPYALISAEMASCWQKGIYIWAREAFGDRMGFFAIWMQWFHNMTWYPAMLAFFGAGAAYLIKPELAHNKIYLMSVILTGFWSLTLFNFLGISTSAIFSSFCVIAGTIVPGVILISMAINWIIQGYPIAISLSSSDIIPNLSQFSSLALLSGIFLSLSGLEANANLATEMENPKKNYPKAIFIGSLLVLLILVFGSLSIAIIVPKQEISLVSGLLDAFSLFFAKYNIEWMAPVIIILAILGAIGELNAWMFAGIKGLYVTTEKGCLPVIFHKVNKKEVPVNLMLFQAIVVTIFTVIIISFSEVDVGYWILNALSAQMYIVMYILLLLAGVRLRFKAPHKIRIYKIPGNNFGITALASLGVLSCLLTLIISFFPPKTLFKNNCNVFQYEGLIIIGFFACCLLPFAIYSFRKPSWKIEAQLEDLKRKFIN